MVDTISAMGWKDRLSSHPLGARILAVVGAVVAVLGAVAVVESIWSLLSSDPLIPVVGKWLRDWGDGVVATLLILGLVALTGWVVWLLYQIFSAVRIPEVQDELPPNTVMADGWLSAGSDITVDIPMEQAATAKSVTFTARQGKRVIVRNKTGQVDNEKGIIRLPFDGDEITDLKDGVVLMDALLITGEGNRLRTSRMAIKTYGPI